MNSVCCLLKWEVFVFTGTSSSAGQVQESHHPGTAKNGEWLACNVWLSLKFSIKKVTIIPMSLFILFQYHAFYHWNEFDILGGGIGITCIRSDSLVMFWKYQWMCVKSSLLSKICFIASSCIFYLHLEIFDVLLKVYVIKDQQTCNYMLSLLFGP